MPAVAAHPVHVHRSSSPHYTSITRRKPKPPLLPSNNPTNLSSLDDHHHRLPSSLTRRPRARKNHSCSLHRPLSSPRRYAILGAGFAGLSVAWHLLQLSPKGSDVSIDVIDEIGIGGGASGVAGGLIHPYSPKVRVLWKGAECWRDCLKMLDVAEIAMKRKACDCGDAVVEQFVWRRGILRPARTLKNAEILKENAEDCLESCRIELMDSSAAQSLVPGLVVPFSSSVYMPKGINIHPKRYLEALFMACKMLAGDLSASRHGEREIKLLQESISSLFQLEGKYDSVIICLGARIDLLPELSGKLPLRRCRGVVTHLQLPKDRREEYGESSPSILSDAWIAAQGPRNLIVGSTWDWNSRDYSSTVSEAEASAAMEELQAKACTVYPALREWEFVGAAGGIRAMPPLTPLGSLPLLGSLDVNGLSRARSNCWLISGLGARGLLYHGFLGNLMASAVISGKENVLPSELTSWKKILAKEVL